MTMQTSGIHHISAFVGSVQSNVDFYAGILGLRLVKKTINFDAPEVYHLYFGNEVGGPGTIITFFPFEGAMKGRIGGGQLGVTTYIVPPDTLPFWEERLAKFAVPFTRSERFGETYIQFADTDGLLLEIVEREGGQPSQWSFGGVPADKAIKGFGGAILYSMAPDKTMQLLQEVMGLERVADNAVYVRFRAAGQLGNIIDVNKVAMGRGMSGAGTVHHIAWRAKDLQDQMAWKVQVDAAGYHSTEIKDRNYFTSIYFREFGSIMFEIATDSPGFTRDEPFEALGEKLMLPEWYEPHRAQIERALTPFEISVREEDRI